MEKNKELVEEILIAPSLKPVKVIKDKYKVGAKKFFWWLENTIKNWSVFKNGDKTYKILDPIKPSELPIFKIEVVESGKIIELGPNELVDLIGEDKFSLKRG